MYLRKTLRGIFIAGLLLLLAVPCSAAITFSDGYWSTTFNCSDWTQPTALSCDGVEMSDNSAYCNDGSNVGSTILSGANYSSGAGGSGWRTFFDGATHNEMSSPIRIVFPATQKEVWIRWYYRLPNGQNMDSNVEHKLAYIFGNVDFNVNWPYQKAYVGIQPRAGDDLGDIIYGENPAFNAHNAHGDGGYGNWADLYGAAENNADGSWHYFELYFDRGTTTSNGIFRMWVDGVNIANDTDLDFFGAGGDGWTHIDIPSNHERFTVLNCAATSGHDIDDIAVALPTYSGFVQNATGFATGLNMIGPVGAPADTTAPSVTAFVIPATATSLTVDVLSFTCTDAVGVTGYCVTTTNSSAGCSWAGSAQSAVTFSAAGAQTAYGWCKDAAENISASVSDGVTITLTAGVTMSGGSSSGGVSQ